MDTVTRCIRLQASLKATEQAVRRHFKESRAAQDRLLKQAGLLVYLYIYYGPYTYYGSSSRRVYLLWPLSSRLVRTYRAWSYAR